MLGRIKEQYGVAFFLVSLLLFWKLNDDSLNSIWMSKFCVLLMALSVGYAAKISSKYSWWLFPILTSTLISGLSASMWFARFSDEPFEVQATLRQAASMGLVCVLIFLVFLDEMSDESANSYKKVFGFFNGLLCLILVGLHLKGWDISWRVPFFENPSMGMCFLIITLPFLFLFKGPFKYLFVALNILLLFLVKASSPLLCLAGVVTGLIILRRQYWVFLLGMSVPVVCLLIKPLSFWAENNGRFHLWSITFKNWWAQELSTKLFGYGLSTTRVITPMVQAATGADMSKGPWFFWLHNDWLQLTLEQGIVGLVCFLMAGIYLVWRTYRTHNHSTFLALLAYGACMVTNFPMHWPTHVFLGFILVRLSFTSIYVKGKTYVPRV